MKRGSLSLSLSLSLSSESSVRNWIIPMETGNVIFSLQTLIKNEKEGKWIFPKNFVLEESQW